jgi:hypothetical protein
MSRIRATANNYKIEKGIPMPDRHPLKGIAEIMRQMEIGDSIVVPMSGRTNMRNYATRTNIQIITKKINEKEVRVWRTK